VVAMSKRWAEKEKEICIKQSSRIEIVF
jgi:hypothetical protein